MLIFKYRNGATVTITLNNLRKLEPREWVFEDCVEIKADGDEARILATWWNNEGSLQYVPATLTEQVFSSAGATRMVDILREKLAETLPSQSQLKDLVEYVIMMPSDLRDRMGITVLPSIPTKAVWRLNHQADPSMGWWGVMETRAGLSWGMLHQGKGAAYREVAEWLGMGVAEMPTGRDALYNGQGWTKDRASLALDSTGAGINVGDRVRVNGIDSSSAGSEAIVNRVQSVKDAKKQTTVCKVWLRGHDNPVNPQDVTVVRKAGGVKKGVDSVGVEVEVGEYVVRNTVALQQEGRESRPVDGAVEGVASIWAEGEWQFKIEALARYLSCMDPTALQMLGLEFKWEYRMGEAMLVREETFVLRQRADVRLEWALWLRRDGFTTAWNLNAVPHWGTTPTFDAICRMVGLDFRLDLRSQFTEQPPRAVALWPHLFKHGVGQPETPRPEPCHDIHGAVIHKGDIVMVECTDTWHKIGATFKVRAIAEYKGVWYVVDKDQNDCAARHVRVVANKAQPEPDNTSDPLHEALTHLAALTASINRAIDARG